MEKRYKDHQISRMIVNPYYEDQNIYEAYPMLKEVVEPFVQNLPDINYHQYFRYLSLCFDPASPMVKEYQSLDQRRMAAADEIGYEGKEHHQIAVEFIKKVVRNRVWTLVCNMDFVFDEYTDKLNQVIDGMDADKVLKAVEMKNKMLSQQVEMIPKREELFNKLFEGDLDMENAEKRMTYTPENIAKHVVK